MVAPLPMRQLSMLPPVWLGGMELAISTSAGATPMVPKCGRTGTRILRSTFSFLLIVRWSTGTPG